MGRMGDKGHIHVSTKDLSDMGSQLARLKEEFENASDIVDGFRGYMGSGELADKMDSFATNWKIHREDLCKAIEGLGKTAEGAAQLYDGVDAHLAAALEKSAKKNSGE
jgi:hypothetical protein